MQNSQLSSTEHSTCGGTFIIKEVTYIYIYTCTVVSALCKEIAHTKGPVRSGK
jgi:hypothetical protein